MEHIKFNTVVDNIINLFIDRLSLELKNIDTAKEIILNIIIEFNKYCLCDQFFTDYLVIFLKKIEPTFVLYDIDGTDDVSIINYSEFFIVFLMILTKYAEDIFFFNRDFSYYYSIPIKRINRLEVYILKNINWDLSIKNLEELSIENI